MAIANGNAVLFWLFARALLDDDFPSARHTARRPAMLCAAGARPGGLPPAPRAPSGARQDRESPAASPLLFGALVIVATLRHWRGDLIEPRRRLRALIVVGGTGYLLLSTLARIIGTDGGRFSAASSLLDMVVPTMITAVIAGGCCAW
ncbi:MAG: hypothetical protein IPM01_26745, partial [Burkholderiaceae bacterium]|nr:hypothetical protein [Burkholderiaceae bacterium]